MLNVSFSPCVLSCPAFVVSRSLSAAQRLAGWPTCFTNQTSGRGQVTGKEGDLQTLVVITSTNLDIDLDILLKKCKVGLEHTPCDKFLRNRDVTLSLSQ